MLPRAASADLDEGLIHHFATTPANRENVAVVEMNRPKAHALNQHLVNDLREAFIHLRESKNIDGAILTEVADLRPAVAWA